MKLRHEWRAGTAVRVAVQDQNTIRQANFREIRRGDFVEVLATMDINERWRYNKKEVFVTWKPIHVVRLATAATVRDVIPRVLPVDGEEGEALSRELESGERSGSVKRVEAMVNELY